MPTRSHNLPEKKCRAGPIAALMLFAVLVLYPLSMGPVLWMYQHRWISERGLAIAYQPAKSVYGQLPDRVRSLYRKYVQLWAMDPPPHMPP